MIPLVAYYFVDGPWRFEWVRYGFDPRKEENKVESYILQTIEIRSSIVSKVVSRLPAEVFQSRHSPSQDCDIKFEAEINLPPLNYFDGVNLSPIMGQLSLADITYEPIQKFIKESLGHVCQVCFLYSRISWY